MKLPLVVLLMFTAIAKASSSYVRTGADGRSWAIGNELVERQLQFHDASGLYTASWRNETTMTDFMRDAAASRRWGKEFAFVADGKQYTGSGGSSQGSLDFRTSNESDIAPAGKERRLVLESKDGRFRVTVHYAVYDGHPVVRKWIEITNLSGRRATLSHLVFEAVNIALARRQTPRWQRFTAWSRASLFIPAAWTMPPSRFAARGAARALSS